MGRSLQFYMTGDDESKVLALIGDRCGYRILHTVYTDEAFKYCDRLNHLSDDTPYQNNQSLAPVSFDPRLAVIRYDTFCRVSIANSECIEFTRCAPIAGSQLRLGRLWYDEKNDKRKVKSAAYIAWCKCVFTVFRETLTHQEGVYFGSNALQQFEAKKLIPAGF